MVKHLERFPKDGIVDAVENVLAFDAFSPDTRRTVARVFQARGIPLPFEAGGSLQAPTVRGRPRLTLGFKVKTRPRSCNAHFFGWLCAHLSWAGCATLRACLGLPVQVSLGEAAPLPPARLVETWRSRDGGKDGL